MKRRNPRTFCACERPHVYGAVNGGGGTDKFRIKIWDKHGMGSAIYDNQMDGTDDAVATTVIAGGDIMIHN